MLAFFMHNSKSSIVKRQPCEIMTEHSLPEEGETKCSGYSQDYTFQDIGMKLVSLIPFRNVIILKTQAIFSISI